MAGFEVVVRPMIFPGIRPASRPSVVSAETDPEKGLAVIRGQSARTVELPYSYSLTWSVAMARETQRRVDVARVYQKPPQQPQQPPGGSASTRAEGAGNINRDNYIDVEVANRITMSEPGKGEVDYHYTPIEPSDNIEILQKNQIRRPKR